MKRIITGEETWDYEYDMGTSRQLSDWRFENETITETQKKPLKNQRDGVTFFRLSRCTALRIPFTEANSD